MGDIFEILAVKFDKTEPEKSGYVEPDLPPFLIVLEHNLM